MPLKSPYSYSLGLLNTEVLFIHTHNNSCFLNLDQDLDKRLSF